jgi:hypothetical protein
MIKGLISVPFSFYGGFMYNIDKSVLDTNGRLLFNISEQLQELITLLKPQEVKEVNQEVRLYPCKKCGATSDEKGVFDTPQKLSVHSRHCTKG